MIKRRREPGSGGVARTTICAKLTAMGVVLGVTGDAGRIEGDKDVVYMALRTFQAGMGTRQREIRFCVIKGGGKPGGSVMARIAAGAKLTLVSIILGMTGNARSIDGYKDIIYMALRTLQAGVRAGQGEI